MAFYRRQDCLADEALDWLFDNAERCGNSSNKGRPVSLQPLIAVVVRPLALAIMPPTPTPTAVTTATDGSGSGCSAYYDGFSGCGASDHYPVLAHYELVG